MKRVMMTSSNGNGFRVTGHLCGEFTGDRWIPRTKASDAELWCFLWYKRLSKQSWGWWFETPSRSSWRHCNGHSSEIRRLWDPRMSVQSTQDIYHLSTQRQWCEFLYQLLKRISHRCIRLEIFVARSTTSHTKICCITILKVIYNWWILSTCNSVCKRWNERQTPPYELTSWARVSHICVSKLTTFGSDDGLSPGRCQATIWTNDGIL